MQRLRSQAKEYDSDIDMEQQRLASSMQATSSKAAAAATAAKAPAAAQAPKKRVKMSTGVQLLAADDMPSKAAGPKKPVAEAGPALQPFHALIKDFMSSQGHTEPTPIQAQCWPACCAGQDVQGVAEPGSGKTLAYLLPAFVKLKVCCQRPATILAPFPTCPWCYMQHPIQEGAATLQH